MPLYCVLPPAACSACSSLQESKRHKLLSPAVTSHDIKVEMVRLGELLENQINFLSDHKTSTNDNFTQLAAKFDNHNDGVQRLAGAFSTLSAMCEELVAEMADVRAEVAEHRQSVTAAVELFGRTVEEAQQGRQQAWAEVEECRNELLSEKRRVDNELHKVRVAMEQQVAAGLRAVCKCCMQVLYAGLRAVCKGCMQVLCAGGDAAG